MAVALAAHGWDLDLHLAIEVLRGEGVGAQHLLGGTHEDDLATPTACIRPEVDDVVGSHHHILVVLYDDDGVAYIAERLEGVDEPLVVALVETDAGLIQDIQYIDELRTYLCGQAYALALTAREGHRGA